MSIEEELAKPLFSLTVGEFLELQKRAEQPVVFNPAENKTEKYVYGIAGLARLFGCSKNTATRIKATGRIDKAITQIGQQIVVNADLALQLAKATEQTLNRRKA